MMPDFDLMELEDLEIEALTDDAIDSIAGGKNRSSDGPYCCSCYQCSTEPV